MSDYVELITYPLKKLAQLFFSIEVGNTNLGSLLIVGSVIMALIGAILHASIHSGNLFDRISNKYHSGDEAREEKAHSSWAEKHFGGGKSQA